jgi:hypothetical protein
LLFASVAVFHGCTGKLVRINDALRRTAVLVLWVLAFYVGAIALAGLSTLIFPQGILAVILSLASVLAGALAGSLCMRGKLPGTRSEPAGPRNEEKKNEEPMGNDNEPPAS